MQRHQMLIGGEWVDAASGETFELENPFLGGPWALVPRAAPADVERAVEAAYDAFKAPRVAADGRHRPGALLRRLGDVVAGEADPAAAEARDAATTAS